MDADNFKKLCREGKIRWSSHGLARMHERDISVADVKNCLMNGDYNGLCAKYDKIS